ncbi:polyketide synthase/peptide synthetase [Paraphaeosphaeria sporulosa]
MASNAPTPIAIIGNGCRLPGAISNTSKLWELLLDPPDLVKEAPADRFRWEGIHREDGRHNGIRTKRAYWLEENLRLFDPHFFSISPSEAETMDPQQRLLLECVYEAMESAGLTLEGLRGSDTGVFVGQMFDDYHELSVKDPVFAGGPMLTTGTVRSITANRVSHVFDFRGPSMCIDTACSSSMVAVHLAVESLRQEESRVAFACGVNLIVVPTVFQAGSRMRMHSADGRCKMFDESGDGYGRGEGIGVLCLKRLDHAIADGDIIEAVIRHTGTNHDGRSRTLTAPSPDAQAELIRQTYWKAGLDLAARSSRPQYVEAHGPGTRVGDPAEAEAIEKAIFLTDQEHADDDILHVGSIKTIVGHTEGTAGIAGVLRAALALQHGIIPPNLHFTSINPKVAARAPHLRIPTTAQPWPSLPEGVPRRASVNSFGFGGTNVHVVMESFDNSISPQRTKLDIMADDESHVFTPFVFSGNSEEALIATLEAHLAYLGEEGKEVSLRDLAWTLQYKRSLFDYRCSIAARSHGELIDCLLEKITTLKAKPGPENTFVRGTNRKPHILAVFPDQGAQYATMGREIIESSLFARGVIDKLDEALATLPSEDRPPWKLKDELLLEENESSLHEAVNSQSLTTAVQILLVSLLKAAGIELEAVVGHSSGEIGAAFAAGFMSAENAIRNAYYRGLHAGRAGSNGKQGAMSVASIPQDEADALCDLPDFKGRITVAAVNSSSGVTLSGDLDAIEEIEARLSGDGIAIKRVPVKTAYHSHHMLPYAAPYQESLEKTTHDSPTTKNGRTAWFSSVHPGVQKTFVSLQYWSENMVRPVLFQDAISAAVKDIGVPDLVLEVGPQPVLKQVIRKIIAEIDNTSSVHICLLKRGSDAVTSFSGALGLIWSNFGREAVNMASIDRVLSSGKPPKPVKNLPTYRWQYDKEYWWQSRLMRKELQSTTPPAELLGSEVYLSASHEAKWRQFLDPKQSPWLLEHKIDGKFVLPASAYVTMLVVAIQTRYTDRNILSIDLKDLRLQQPIAFASEYTKTEVVLTLHDLDETSQCIKGSFTIDSCADQAHGDLITASRGGICIIFGEDEDRSYPEVVSQPQELVDVMPDTFYRHTTSQGLHYQGSFRNIVSAQRKMGFAIGQITLTPSELILHPAVLDGLFQGANIAGNFPGDSALPDVVVPSLIRRITLFPTRCKEITDRAGTVKFQAISNADKISSGLLHSGDTGVAVQFDGLVLSPYRLTTSDEDVKMYSEVVWEPVYRPWKEHAHNNLLDSAETHASSDTSSTHSLFSAGDGSVSPARSSSPSQKSRETLMILGTALHIAKELEELLATAFQRVVCISSLEDINKDVDVPYVVLSIVELEEPIFMNMTRKKWQAIQRLFSDATDVLWVTSGTMSPKSIEAVYANMTVGLARSIRHELLHLRVQILDIDEPKSVTAQFIADAMAHWHDSDASATIGPHAELSYKGGAVYAPVVHRLGTLNDRYNSQHRKITRKVDPRREVVELVQTKSQSYSFQVLPQIGHLTDQGSHTPVEILHCTQLAFKIKGLGYLYLGIGRATEGQFYLVLLEKICTLARVRSDRTFPCGLSSPPDSTFLQGIVAEFVARTVIRFSSAHNSMVLICSDPIWVFRIKSLAREFSRSVVFVTGMHKSGCEGATYISKHSLDVAVCEIIPTETSVVVNLSNRPEDTELFSRAREILKDRSITFKDKNIIFQKRALLKHGESIKKEVLTWLTEISKDASSSGIPVDLLFEGDSALQPRDMLSNLDRSASAIANWSQSTVQVPIRTATEAVRFKASNTYLIVGTSEIARSICEWMASCEAKYFVMVSRNTDVVAPWAQIMHTKGIVVRLHSADMTNEASINHVIASIKTPDVDNGFALPPIGGLIDLATIFRDGAFTNISYNAFRAVADVKAKGSLLLHNCFSNLPLDFFILTSSLSYITGNPGQANYNAGNAFMASLARYRRSIGLPASVVHLGTVAGIGHMAKQGSAGPGGLLNEDVRAGAYPISERDLHQIFAEAVLASPADSRMDAEIITGLKDIDRSFGNRLHYVKEPMFRNVIRDSSRNTGLTSSVGLSAKLSLRQQLAAAIGTKTDAVKIEEALLDIVRPAFIEKLKALLQVEYVDDAKSVIDLGIDSLAVAEVESWVKKELRVKIQRSVFFGGSVGDVVGTVVKSLDKEWVLDR